MKKNTNILAIETSTEACSVALLTDKDQLFSEFALTPRQHTQYLPRMMDSVLVQAGLFKKDLTHIAYASGPGAFTGVRIAASTAQGISIGLNIPLVAISTLAILAQHAQCGPAPSPASRGWPPRKPYSMPLQRPRHLLSHGS